MFWTHKETIFKLSFFAFLSMWFLYLTLTTHFTRGSILQLILIPKNSSDYGEYMYTV